MNSFQILANGINYYINEQTHVKGNDMKISFIGMGNMAQAIAQGFINSGKVNASDMYAYAPTKEKLLKNSSKIGFNPCDSVNDAAKNGDIVIIACKPYQIKDVLDQIGSDLKGKALVSIAAGWTFDTFEEILKGSVRIQCIMPNTPAMVGEGVMLFEAKNSLTDTETSYIKDIFASLGTVETLPTNLMGIGGAISGCGPAFMDLVMEAYADAAVKYGIGRDMAYRMISQTMLGSAKLQQATGQHPGVLKDAVCSPNGTTIRGVATLEEKGLRSACISSIDTIMDFKKSK